MVQLTGARGPPGRQPGFGFAALLLAICASPAGADTLGEILTRGEVRVCTTGDYAPFSLWNEATRDFEGIDIDMAHDLGRELEVEVRFVATTWPTLERDFTSGACDIAMSGISIRPERRSWAEFSRSYRSGGKTPIARCEDVEKFQTVEQINQSGVRVLVNPGGSNERFAARYLGRADLRRHPDNTAIFAMIAEGRGDVMVTDVIETRLQSRLDPRLCSVHPEAPFSRADMAYLLPQDEAVWRIRVDLWLRRMERSGAYQGIEDRWVDAAAER
jgi:cyclohexadienyl dehydratase